MTATITVSHIQDAGAIKIESTTYSNKNAGSQSVAPIWYAAPERVVLFFSLAAVHIFSDL